jgi:hypothetical protein
MEPVIGNEEGVLCVTKQVSEEDAQLVEHLDGPENEGLVGLVGLLEVRPHQCRGKVQGKCVYNNEHHWGVDILEGNVADELGFNDSADVC